MPVRRARCVPRTAAARWPCRSYELFTSTELLGELTLERVTAMLSTRRYRAWLKLVGVAVEARRFRIALVGRSPVRSDDPTGTRRDDQLGSLGVGSGRVDDRRGPLRQARLQWRSRSASTPPRPPGLVEGSTENATVVRALLADVEPKRPRARRVPSDPDSDRRRLKPSPRECARSLAFGRPAVRRRQLHKVEGQLSKAASAIVAKKTRGAYRDPDLLDAGATLEALARSLVGTSRRGRLSAKDSRRRSPSTASVCDPP